MLERDRFLDEINELARVARQTVNICLVLDRGYYKLDAKRHSHLNVFIDMPTHLNSPVKRVKGVSKAPLRKYFTNAEVLHNRAVASRRACNEIANVRLKWNRVFQRRIPLSLMPMMGHFQTLAIGLARLRSGVKPNESHVK